MIIEYSRVRPDAKPPMRANPSDVSNNGRARGVENDENGDDSTGTCTPRTPIPNPLKQFRFVCKQFQYQSKRIKNKTPMAKLEK